MCPRQLIERPKQGFGIPLDAGCAAAARMVGDIVECGETQAGRIFNFEPIRKKWEEHLSGRPQLAVPSVVRADVPVLAGVNSAIGLK